MQPDDSGQAAEHLALPALPQHEAFARALRIRRCTRSDERVHRTDSSQADIGRSIATRGPELEKKLGRIHHVGSIGGERDQHLIAYGERSRDQTDEVDGVQREHEDAEHVLPEEGPREEIATEDLALPDRAGDHDGVEEAGLDYDRRGRESQTITGREIADHQTEAEQEGCELNRRQHALHDRPR